ncbi:farnesyl pyrophosphate synthase-like, partial [Stegodyphus dumicola]|uniref:farnesyl pyrophosphate synthase-like n=1 Tax=Stegodyphus dumicola TaxID=202533 RepID=UPI0015ACA807
NKEIYNPKAELSSVTGEIDPDLVEFDKVCANICRDLVEEDNESLGDALEWCEKVFNYNVRTGKKIRGLAVLKAFKFLSQNKYSAEDLNLACILGWCIEMLQAFFIITDDVMDESTMRRGKICWYQKPEVGLCAVNDAILLHCGVYKVLRKHFEGLKSYMNILHEFIEVVRKTAYGQCLDMLNNPPNQRPKFENFLIQRYNTNVEYKTSYYTYCLPIHLAMHLVGNCSVKEFESSQLLCLKLGRLFQIQDDYLDCYGESNLTGKVGNDIKEGKCTWLAVTFLAHASEAMKNEMMESYGIDNSESVFKVLKLYEALELEKKYKDHEEELYSEIKKDISHLQSEPMEKLFDYLLHKIYERKK